MNLIEEIYEILFQFGGGRGGDPGNVAVRFLLPTFFWAILAWVAFREWKTDQQRKDLYVGIAALIGMFRELLMFVAEYGSWRGQISFDLMYNYYPPLEHAATMFSCIFIGAAFLRYLQVSEKFVRSFFFTSSVITGLLYIVTAPAWQNYLREQPGVAFGLFWGDLAFRIAASLFMGTVVNSLLNLSQQGKFTPRTLIVGFTFLFLDEFLMIFNIVSRERYVQYFAPLRHNLHIWAIPLFIAFYWTDLRRRMSAAHQLVSNSFSLSPGMLCVFDQNGIIQVTSPAASRIVGAMPDELRGQDIRNVCIPVGNTNPLPSLNSSAVFEEQCTLKDGSVRYLSWNVYHSPEDGCLYAVISDGTRLKLTEDALAEAIRTGQQEKAKTEAIIAAIGDGISIQDREFRIIYQNQIYKDMLGDHIGEFCYTAYAKQKRICTDCPVFESFRDGCIHTMERQFIIGDKRKSFRITVAPLRDQDNRIIAGIEVVRDITAEQSPDNDVVKTQRIESLGVMAGGIAHDFNNLLTVIMGNISLASLKTEKQSPALVNLQEAEKAAERAKDLVQQILTFSQGGDPVRQKMHLEEVVKETASLALHGCRSTPRVIVQDNLLPVEIDRGQVSQAISNIIANADQAMPDGGIVTINCSNVVHEDALPSSLSRGRKYVVVATSDTGVGILPEYRGRIFEPYFSTKQKARGLGLAVADSIIRKHGGLINVDSRPGAGSTFRIYLPVSDKRADGREVESTHLYAVEGKVLIMDDEEAVREIAGEILRLSGCSVAFAADGREAVELYRKAMGTGDPFDAVVLDLTVPGGMGGRETMEELLEVDSGVQAIVSSGYSNDAAMSNYQEYGFCDMVAKPYLPADLCKAVFSAILKGRRENGQH
ncbi:MAG: response regulator [Nitrospirae bacterium]|nr:response regulator [Nitrospirota bacterium]